MFKRVACAVSGGVDSAVALLLLKRRGLDVLGVHMCNWDLDEEAFSAQCVQDANCIEAERICNALHVPFVRVDFVRHYWHEVFAEYVFRLKNGLCPLADVLCNSRIKFGKFFDYASKELGTDAIATGHYAANSFGDYLEHFNDSLEAKLLRPQDKFKDQTLFLSQISQNALRRTMFPLSKFTKAHVKSMASSVECLQHLAVKRESTGLCMVGRRHFKRFIEQYVEPNDGNLIDAQSGRVLGKHDGLHKYIIGERVRVSSTNDGRAYFVCDKDKQSGDIFVCPGANHRLLFTNRFFTSQPHWINRSWLEHFRSSGSDHHELKFKFKHPQSLLIRCRVHLENANDSCGLVVDSEWPLRALNPGQYATFYDATGRQCLGSAEVSRAQTTDLIDFYSQYNNNNNTSENDGLYSIDNMTDVPKAFLSI